MEKIQNLLAGRSLRGIAPAPELHAYEELTARQRAIVALHLMRHSVETEVTHEFDGKAYADDDGGLVLEDLT